uniref:CSON000887 protein n=1 Tax=Culicoides sonorensis TaxID=179676 RepID=A0A336KX98_CULSO
MQKNKNTSANSEKNVNLDIANYQMSSIQIYHTHNIIANVEQRNFFVRYYNDRNENKFLIK